MNSMDISVESNTNIVSNLQSSSGLSISVHPLVLLNISDHYTRIRLQNPSIIENGRVFGALLASQSGRDIDIVNSFELPFQLAEDGVNHLLDKTFLLYKLDQRMETDNFSSMKQVFPTLDFMGWYSIGIQPTELDLKLHEQFLGVNESSLFLQMNPAALVNGTKQFPIEIYEPIMDMVDGNYTRLVFIKTSYKLETGEAERIAIDHVAKPSSTTSDTSLGNARTTVVLYKSQMILIFISSCLSSNNSKKRNRNATF
ncbi:hypothetical protein RO3G_05709 [Rhizopus delemar RA 99-880]|uniref:COP9 signalosome complex subunit 6 n=1 Tax=Rhizopus delemar (strain RA 99-880 / ATCC MYA-4621 / FGSC 9543 / NRRL 43880) TaxID=246409 RepID=I1BXS4_RHIO9|nr:hypothetical protein RO3G_05709 [Rhizopus delemar RA 99-880]|eukprot:EIE81004.1 hypothetical protein RO3G_05709 [Rhizopus delemar RA 99-880]